MKERPILFSAPMVQAILAGTKTQTRRVVKPQPSDYPSKERTPPPIPRDAKHSAPYFDAYCGSLRTASNPRGMGGHWCWWDEYDRQGPDWIRCPYGVPGEHLWVRETWARLTGNGTRTVYRADADPPLSVIDQKPVERMKWTPAIHMPRTVSRILLEVESVRVEPLQAISATDMRAEGIACPLDYPGMTHCTCMPCAGLRGRWVELWDSINAARGFGWRSNPWVWAVSFKALEPKAVAA